MRSQNVLFHQLMKSQQRSSREDTQPPACEHSPVVFVPGVVEDAQGLERAARLFAALGDAQRLRVLCLLLRGEMCVTAIVAALGDKFPTVSQRLRVLRSEGLVARRREKSHVYYSLADAHVRGLISNAVAHADELNGSGSKPEREDDE